MADTEAIKRAIAEEVVGNKWRRQKAKYQSLVKWCSRGH